jgi:predicted membrane protein
VSFKWVTNRSIPTISYMTSLDRYQIIQIIFLAMCCVWHSTISSIKMEDYERKVLIDRVALAVFALVFFLIQVVFSIMIYTSWLKIKKLKKLEENFLRKTTLDDQNESDSDDE